MLVCIAVEDTMKDLVVKPLLFDPGVFEKENYPDGKTRAFQL